MTSCFKDFHILWKGLHHMAASGLNKEDSNLAKVNT